MFIHLLRLLLTFKDFRVFLKYVATIAKINNSLLSFVRFV